MKKKRMSTIFYTKRMSNSQRFLLLGAPMLLFPLAYFPYVLWWRGSFAMLVERLMHGELANPLRLLFTGNNTILLYWLCITGLVMLLAAALSIWKLRPWLYIPVYLAVMFSLCGIMSLGFYTLIVR